MSGEYYAKRLSVILITWNQREMTRACLESFLPAIDPALDEIVLIDNGSTDGTAELIAREFPQVVYRLMPENLGVGPARNRGIALASGCYLMTLDNDTLLPATGSLGEAIEEIFAAHPDFGLFGFKLLNPDGSRQQSARRFPRFLNPIAARIPGAKRMQLFQRMLSEHLMEDTEFDSINEIMEVDYVLGANQIFRREILADVEGYDPGIFYGPEDYEFCLRVWRSGWKVGWSPKREIVHEHRRITRKFSRTTLRFLRAHLYVFAKHRSLNRLNRGREPSRG